VRRERPDLLYAWEYYQCLDAYYVELLLKRIPMVVTGMLMDVTRLLPKALPTTFGTPELVDRARALNRRKVKLLLPAVDAKLFAPGSVDPQPFRERVGIMNGDVTLVTVSRLDDYMKAESLHRTINAVRTLGRDLPLRFVIVGDGIGRSEVEQSAREANALLRREAVVLTGFMADPRPAYAAADIHIGMGNSALRAMAFGKPGIIVGVRGFSAPFTPDTAGFFYYKGIYGVGNGESDNARLIGDIRGLVENPRQLAGLGEFSRQFILKHFDLPKVSREFSEFCHYAVENQPRFGSAVADGIRTAGIWLSERRWNSHGC
jgi:L-malate glycosyltransferase